MSIIEPRISAEQTVKVENAVGNGEWVFEIFKGPVVRELVTMLASMSTITMPWSKMYKEKDRTLVGIGRPLA